MLTHYTVRCDSIEGRSTQEILAMNEQHAAELWLLIQLPHPMDIVAMCPMHVIVWSREGKKHRFSVGLAEVKPENAGNLVDVELLGVDT